MSFLKHIPATSTPDEQLVAAYQQSGNLETLSELYTRYMPLVFGVCLKYLKDEEDGKDAVLDIFEQLVVKLQKHQVGHFKGWLYQLAKNHCLMILRKSKNFSRTALDVSLMQNDDNVHLNGVMEKEEHLTQMHACLAQLSAEQKTTVELFYLEGKCYNEIADITGIEWNKVRSYIQNGRRNLKLCMDKKLEKTT